MIHVFTTLFAILIIACIWIADAGLGDQVYATLKEIPFGDKIGHFFMMGLLSFFVNLSLKARSIIVLKRPVLLGSAIVLGLVTLEELSQGFIPHRTLSIFDWTADFLGIVLMGRLAKWLMSHSQLFKDQS